LPAFYERMTLNSPLKEIRAIVGSGGQPSQPPLIVEVCPCYVNLESETGGISNIVRQICSHLSASQRQVLLLCGNTDLGKVVARPGRETVNEYLRVQVFPQRPHPWLGPTGLLRAAVRALPRDCVAHVHTCFSAFSESAMAVFSRRGIPFIFTPHGKLSPHTMRTRKLPKRIWWSLVARRYVQRASTIALSGSAESDLFPSLGLRKDFLVIPNGYEAPLEASTGIPTGESPYVLFLGYLDPRKQPEFLVRAFARSKAVKSHKLLIVGPDAYGHEAVLCRTVEECKIRDRVVILGPKYGTDKWRHLRQAACLALPSRGEGLPVVLCEALGAGVPSVYSKACNFPEVEAQGAGIEIEGFSEAKWAEAIDRVCLDREAQSRMRAAASRMGADYSWERTVARWRDLYDTVWRRVAIPHSASQIGLA
jgi:glycosyltransferase involved in cell wall biosynthesis